MKGRRGVSRLVWVISIIWWYKSFCQSLHEYCFFAVHLLKIALYRHGLAENVSKEGLINCHRGYLFDHNFILVLVHVFLELVKHILEGVELRLHCIFQLFLFFFKGLETVWGLFQLFIVLFVSIGGFRILRSLICDSATLVFPGCFVSHLSENVLVWSSRDKLFFWFVWSDGRFV